jgi:hypothetical protein
LTVVIDRQWRVRAARTLDLPLPASAVWGQMRDFRRFIAIDSLHTTVIAPPGAIDVANPAGAPLIIPHRFLGIGPDRIGRILRWHEGRGYVFSDLSRRGVRSGFPHVCAYEVSAAGPEHSRLTVWARGKWTAVWVPRPLARLWVWWVMRATELRLILEFDAMARWLRGRR